MNPTALQILFISFFNSKECFCTFNQLRGSFFRPVGRERKPVELVLDFTDAPVLVTNNRDNYVDDEKEHREVEK